MRGLGLVIRQGARRLHMGTDHMGHRRASRRGHTRWPAAGSTMSAGISASGTNVDGSPPSCVITDVVKGLRSRRSVVGPYCLATLLQARNRISEERYHLCVLTAECDRPDDARNHHNEGQDAHLQDLAPRPRLRPVQVAGALDQPHDRVLHDLHLRLRALLQVSLREDEKARQRTTKL